MNLADYEHMLAGLDADIAASQSNPAKPALMTGTKNTVGLVSHDGPGYELSEIPTEAGKDSTASFSTTGKTNPLEPTNLLLKSPKPRKTSAKCEAPRAGPIDKRPTIEIRQGELDRIVNDMERELSKADGYYNRGNLITSVVQDLITPACIKPLPAPALTRALSRSINFVCFDGRTGGLKSIDPAPKYVNALFDAESYPHLPPLRGIARQPHFRHDGSLCMTAGYDAATGLFGAFNPADYSVKEAPSQQDAQHALNQISALLSGFDFQDGNAKAAALAAILTAAIRPTLATAPMFHAAAHQPSSGKSYLLKIIAGFAGADNPAMLSMPPNDEEFRKLLLATLLEAPPVVTFDNLSGDIQPFGSFCTALTEPTIQGRVLGASKNATVSTRAVFLSSGNNVGPVRDMARRVITIRLDPKVENPALRQFADAPATTLERQRGEFVSHALTIIRAHRVAGSPRARCTGFGGYDDWAALVRHPLLWLGVADPVANVVEQLAIDPDREELGRLLTAWRKVFGSSAAHVADAVEKTQPGAYGGSTELFEVCMELAEERGQINRRRLGKWIGRHAGRIVGGLRFEKGTAKSYSQKWQVVQVAGSEKSANSRLVGFSRVVFPMAEKLAEPAEPPAQPTDPDA
jgi:hypothetical protein